MGIEGADLLDRQTLDLGLLRAPKRILICFYVFSLFRCAWTIFVTPMYEEEYVIRLIYMAIMAPLLGFIAVDHRWAMSSAFALYLCYVVATFLFIESFINLVFLGVILFIGAMTIRAVIVVDLIKRLNISQNIDVFE